MEPPGAEPLVYHFNAGSSARSSADWLCNPAAKASPRPPLVLGREAVGRGAVFEKGVELVPHKLRQVGASRGLSRLE